MRRLWMSALLAPVLALAVPAVALAAPSVPAQRTVPAAARPVQFGQHGSAVRKLQRRLAALKYYPGADRRPLRHRHAGGRVGVPGGAGAAG